MRAESVTFGLAFHLAVILRMPVTDEASLTATKPDRPAFYLLLLILLAALALRLANIRFGYPLPVHPDEPVLVDAALHIVKTLNLNPTTLMYPSLPIYLQALLFGLVSLATRLVTGAHLAAIPVIKFYIYARALSAFIGTATIYVAYEIGRRLFNVWVAVAAAVFIAVSSVHVTNSYYATVDAPMSFWSLLACLMAVLIYTKGGNRWFYIAAGVCAGFAVGSKYTAFPAVVPLLVAHIHQARRGNRWFTTNLWLGLLAVPIAFVLSTPFALLDSPWFVSALVAQRDQYSGGQPGNEAVTRTSLLPYLTYLAKEGYGRLPTILALVGTIWLAVRDRAKAALLLAFPAPYFLFLGLHKVYFARQMMPVVPFLALLTGYGIYSGADRLGHVWSRHRGDDGGRAVRATVGVVLIAIGVRDQLAKDVEMIRQNSLPDTRWVSLQWIEANVPPGVSIGREHYTPPLEAHSDRYRIAFLDYFGVIEQKERVPSLDYMIASSGDYARFVDHPDRYPAEALAYNRFFAANEVIKEFVADGKTMTGPTIRVYKIKH